MRTVWDASALPYSMCKQAKSSNFDVLMYSTTPPTARPACLQVQCLENGPLGDQPGITV